DAAAQRQTGAQSFLTNRQYLQGLLQTCLTLSPDRFLNGHFKRAPRADQNDHLLTARDRGIEQFAAEHGLLDFVNRNDDERVLTALAAVNRDGESCRELRKRTA